MRRFIIVILFLSIFLFNVQGCTSIKSQKSEELGLKVLKYEDIVDKLIRFHVLANSDSKEDQALKLKVRDRVIQEVNNKLKSTKDLDQARNVLISSIDDITTIAEEVIKENNYNYSVKTMLSNENFPDKIYGDYLFPQGNYEAFRVIIGDGEGQNWWCVLFPPLCFVDETKNTVNSEGLDKRIEDGISGDEVENNKNQSKKKTKVVFKFKLIETIGKYFN